MACSHRALGSSSGGGMQEVDFQEVDAGQDFNVSHPCQRNNPLWHKKVGWRQARPRSKFNRRGAPEGKKEEPT